MADPTQNPIESGLSYATKMNPYGQTADELKANIEAGQKGVEALQQRYANPNWFNVAAGFFKPQLGGFGASLGSASEAMGDWLEKQRANELPIYNAQQQLQFMKNQLAHKQIAADLAAKTVTQPGGTKATDVSAIAYHDPNMAAITQAQLDNEIKLRKEIAEQAKLGVDVNGTYGADVVKHLFPNGVPSLSPVPGSNNVNGPAGSGTPPAGILGSASSKTVPDGTGFTQAQWDNLGATRQNEILGALGSAKAKQMLENNLTAGTAISESTNALKDLASARILATSPGMEKMLGLGSGTNAVSALWGWLASGEDASKFTPLHDAAVKLQQDDPQAYANFQVLQNTLAKYVVDARAGIQNPSVGAQNLLASTKPNVLQSQEAIVKLLDLIAHDHSSRVRQGVLRQSYKGDPTLFETNDPRYKDLTNRIINEHTTITNNPADRSRLPRFYSPYEALSDLPSVGKAPAANQAPTAAKPEERPNTRVFNGVTYVRTENGYVKAKQP